MCDKYIFYIYTCLKWRKFRLTEDELSCLFGSHSDLFAQLDPKWISRFMMRCRILYEGELKRSLDMSPLSISNNVYRVRTGPGTFTTADSRGHIVQIENYTDLSLPRKLSFGETAFAVFEETLSVFSDVAFRIQGGGAPALPSLVICRRSDSQGTAASLCSNWQTRYTVKERDIRGLKVLSGYIYTTDGVSLYSLVSSLKTDICLIFDEGCREEIVRTLCALAIGDSMLGIQFRLKCVLPDQGKCFDMRDLDPLESGSALPDTCIPREIKLEPLTDRHSSPLSHYNHEGLASLRDMTRLPSGFSILAENQDVVVLRHLLRDAVVIVPKTMASMTKGDRGTVQLRTSNMSAPSGYITEWFPCDRCLFRVERGIPGVPPVVIHCSLCRGEEDGHLGKEGLKSEVPTLHVTRHSAYERVLPRGFRSSSHIFNQSVCLLPETMDIVAPRVLRFAGCVAIMYAFNVFRQLSVSPSELASSPVQLSFMSTLSLREAQTLLLSYLCLKESFVASDKSCFRLTVKSLSILSELRKIVSANPRVHSDLVDLELSGAEEVMCEELEGEILRIRHGLACKDSKDDSNWDSNGEESEQRQDSEDSSQGDTEDYDWEDSQGDEDEESKDTGEEESNYTREEDSECCSSDGEAEDDTDDEDRVVANISTVIGTVPRTGQTTGHLVLFGRGQGCKASFKWITIGIRTLGLVNLRILRACGVFNSKHGHSRAMLKIPNTNGVVPQSSWAGEPTLLTDDFCVIVPEKRPSSLQTRLLDNNDCFFQLNYSPKTGRAKVDSGSFADGGIVVEMSRIEQAVCSEDARGYEEHKLFRLFKTCRRKVQQCLFDVAVDDPDIADPGCRRPLYKRSWLRLQRQKLGSSVALSTIGDGEFFPSIEIAKETDLDESDEDMLSYPLSEYNLNLTVKCYPNHYSMVRADRAPGECGSVYEACLDEAVLLGHCARVSVTRGAKRNFDVSACLTWFYRSVHPCVPDMAVGDVMLDYEFTVHGRGELSPVYALLSHLAESCRVNCFPMCKLITLTRHRGSSVWTRGADEPFHSQRLRANTIGAFLCAQDHRLAPLLSRCCNPSPVQASELWEGCELLPRGDEEQLLLRAYSSTLGPVFEFEKVECFPSKVRSSLGDWSFMRLASRSYGVNRYPGTTVVDGYTVAFASESPLFYLRDEGPLVQKLESVAIVVESSSLYRTDVLKKEDPEWPGPDTIDSRERIKCKNKSSVINDMFMRSGGRDPLEGYEANQRSWKKLIATQWTFNKAPGEASQDQDWEQEYPLSENLNAIGSLCSHVAAVKWLCDAPPASVPLGLTSSRGKRVTGMLPVLGRVELDSRTARIRDPAAWKGFDDLCSRVLTCPREKVWTRGTSKVVNKGLATFRRDALVPISNLILIVEPGEWYASPCHGSNGQGDGTKRDSPVDVSLIYHREVCSASEFVEALACRMLSGEVHEELEVQCLRRGVYKYLQRALAWFAGATGPFRSRTVTVFTPEADSGTQRWTHTLPPGLDVLKTCSTGYLISCKKPCCSREDVTALLAKSKGVIRVNSSGNLVLHSNPGTLKVSAMQGEAGVHAVIKTPLDSVKCGEIDCSEVHVRCNRSLSEFCKLRCLPKGIRGPETWKKPLPWSKRDPGSFCTKVSELKYRWESGRADFTEAPARDSAGRFWYGKQLREWKRCSDGKLIPRRERFWYLIDYKESFARRKEGEVVSYDEREPGVSDSSGESSDGDSEKESESEGVDDHEESGSEESVEDEDDKDDAQADEESGSRVVDDHDESGSEESVEDEDVKGSDNKKDQDDVADDGTPGPIMVNCEWRERGVSCFMILNSCLEIEFIPRLPGDGGHVFFEPVHNEDYRTRAQLDNKGRLVKYYKPHKFFSVMYDVYTVLVYGCGLRPVFVHGQSDAAGSNVLNTVMATLCLADRVSPAVYPIKARIAIVVHEGREEILKLAREVSRCIVVTTGCRKRAGALSYAFRELRPNLEREASLPWAGHDRPTSHYPLPEKFICDAGVSAFAQLTTLWPSVSKRSDVNHPACSRDPRWIGLMLCLAEWEGRRQIADTVAPGALEALISSIGKGRE